VTKLCFIDTETTGLDPDLHEIWEVALIEREPNGSEVERLWQLPVDLGRADAMALKIGRWYERRWPGADSRRAYDPGADAVAVSGFSNVDERFVVSPEGLRDWAALFAEVTDGAHLVGAVISFDEERLRRLMRRHGACPTWHYHIIDVEALAAGWLAAGHDWDEGPPSPFGDKARPPWDSSELSAAVGVDPEKFDRHTAMGDAQWARAIYDAVMGVDAS
jgi:DNA polymerase III epsilon subunit-like protein